MNQRSDNFDLNAEDRVDHVIHGWAEEIPDLDTSGLSIVGRILRLSHELEYRISKRLKPFGISYSEFNVLATLRRSGGSYELTPKSLMQSALITSGAMTTLLDRLTERGYILRGRSEEDGRIRTARLTEMGLSLVENTLELRFDEASEAIECLSSSESESTAVSLRKIANWLEALKQH